MKIKRVFIAGLALSLVLLLSACQKSEPVENPPSLPEVDEPQALDTQVDEKDFITVSVTPLSIFEKGENWDFEISLDTHSGDLTVDLLQDSILVDAEGQEFKPLNWDGDPAGGHHFSGVLSFNPLDSEYATLKIANVSESGVRTFTFNNN